MNMRTNSKKDQMYAAEIQFLPPVDPTDWSDPLIVITWKCVDARDGAQYYEQDPIERFRLSELIARGIYTAEEAQTVVGLILKAAVMWGIA